MVETCAWYNIKCLQSDINGGEYVLHEFNASYEQLELQDKSQIHIHLNKMVCWKLKNRTSIKSAHNMLNTCWSSKLFVGGSNCNMLCTKSLSHISGYMKESI